MSELRPPPRRFVDAAGPSGQLLRQVLAEPELCRPLPRFIDLRERRLKRARFQRIAGTLTATTLALLAVWALNGRAEAPVIRAELVASHAAKEPPPSARPLVAPPPVSAARTPSVQASSTPSPEKPKPRAPNAARTGLGAREAAPRPTATPAAELGGAKTCAGLARAGAAEEAIACYEKLAGGSGISAELALFEQARLAGKMLNQPDRALLTLQKHRERFPHGALRAEVMLAQIDGLVTSGQSSQALALIDEALRSGLLRERKAELEQVRARLQPERAPGR
jgi:hypothetical protein